jgi:hypothetical protein
MPSGCCNRFMRSFSSSAGSNHPIPAQTYASPPMHTH